MSLHVEWDVLFTILLKYFTFSLWSLDKNKFDMFLEINNYMSLFYYFI
jgi:hypothetical protein